VLVKADKLGLSPNRSFSALQPAWSPDSKWLSYVATLQNGVSAAFLYNLATENHTQITDGMSDVNAPSFSRDGKYLFFAASTDVGLTNSGLHMSAYQRPVNYSVYALILSKKTPSLYKTESDEESVTPEEQAEKKKEAPKKDKKGKDEKSKETPAAPVNKSIEIDLADLSNRIIALPIPAGGIQGLEGSVEGQLLYFRKW
jgi:tricorn protease